MRRRSCGARSAERYRPAAASAGLSAIRAAASRAGPFGADSRGSLGGSVDGRSTGPPGSPERARAERSRTAAPRRPDHARRRPRRARDGPAGDDAHDAADGAVERAHDLTRFLERGLQLDARDDRAGPGPADPPRLADPRDEARRGLFFAGDAQPGDILSHNDPAYDGSHIADWCMYQPSSTTTSSSSGLSARGTWPTQAGLCPELQPVGARHLRRGGLRAPDQDRR